MTELYITEVMEQTMADGPGLRTSIYCAGCRHHCPGCHNPQSWNFENGHKMSVNDLLQIIKDDDLSNVSFSGGDPFYQVEGFTELARRIKEETDKTICAGQASHTKRYLQTAACQCCFLTLTYLSTAPMSRA